MSIYATLINLLDQSVVTRKSHVLCLVTAILALPSTLLAETYRENTVNVWGWTSTSVTQVYPGNGTKVSLKSSSGTNVGVVSFPATYRPFLEIPLTGIKLNDFLGVAASITNTGADEIIISANIDEKHDIGGTAVLQPGETDTIGVYFKRSDSYKPAYIDAYLLGVGGLPGGFNSHWVVVDPDALTKLTIFTLMPSSSASFEMGPVFGWGKFAFPSEQSLQSGYFPWIDTYGQYKYESWVGKKSRDLDFRIDDSLERIDMQSYVKSPSLDNYRGWASGPSLAATGHFYTAKYQGKWWLVTPTGKLFWAFSADVFRTNTTLVEGRANWFESLPGSGQTGSEFYGTSGYGKTYDITVRNLQRKFGSDWLNLLKQRTHDRFLSWGLNSFGGWSDPSFVLPGQETPYFEVSYIYPKTLDLTDTAAFRKKMHDQLQTLSPKNMDPWLVGVFVGNEMPWGNVSSDIRVSTAKLFYRIIREEFKIALPNKLFLCDRLNTGFWEVKDVAAEYCDVVSINRYAFSGLGNLLPPTSIDKPVIISEFQFGSIDEGGLGGGTMTAASQKHKGEAMEVFLRQLIQDSSVVGASYYVFRDEPRSGGPGVSSNSAIGFVDVADRPYPSMVQAARRVSRSMYDLRSRGIWNPAPLVFSAPVSIRPTERGAGSRSFSVERISRSQWEIHGDGDFSYQLSTPSGEIITNGFGTNSATLEKILPHGLYILRVQAKGRRTRSIPLVQS